MNSENQETKTFIDLRDGKTYKTIKIGNQTWMAENLAYKAESGCWAYDNDEKNVVTYGYLYDWETANKVCPEGWHLPDYYEWETLIEYSGGNEIAGEKLKTISGWYDTNIGDDNNSGFSALPSGCRGYDSSFVNLGYGSNWWSSKEFNVSQAWYCEMDYKDQRVYLFQLHSKLLGFSVRCIKNNENNKIEDYSNKEIPNTFVDSRDGKTYQTLKIGTQTWMIENLAYNANSDCWAFNNDELNKYGYLYKWETAKEACPSGWHLPSKEEWEILINYLGGRKIAGCKLKSINGWKSPNTGANNSSGFSALPGGFCVYNEDRFSSQSYYGIWWSITEIDSTYAWTFDLDYNDPGANMHDYPKDAGFSVRCIKNY